MRLLLSIILSFSSAITFAQFGNEWIDYDRQYWQFPVVEEGLYRITYEQMVQAGFPTGGVFSEELRIFARGEQQFIHVEDGGDGSLQAGDYIEFYATGNDGWLDAAIYDEPSNQANAEYSLFNDTLRYFLTTGTGQSLRTQDFSPQASLEDLEPAPWIWYKRRGNYTSEYLLGDQDINGISLPWYQKAEGWFDNRFSIGQTVTKNITHPFPYTEDGAPDVQISAASASASIAPGAVNHHLQVGYGSPLTVVVDTIYYGYQLNQFSFSVPANELSGNATAIVHRSIDDLNVATDWHAVGWVQLEYAREPSLPGNSIERFELKGFDLGNEQRLDIEQFEGAEPRLYQVSDFGLTRSIPVEDEGGTLRAICPVEGIDNSTQLILLDGSSVNQVTGLQPVTQTGYFTNYLEENVDSAFVLISHPKLSVAANNYSFYRESQGMDVLQADIEELYMQYAGGVWKHPLAIRRFIDDLITNGASPPSHLFLLGKSIFEMTISATQGARNNPERYARNLVPSWGYPTSDVTFTSGLGDTNIEMAVPTGRLAAEDLEQALDYLNKVAEFEAQEPQEWMKRVLHFGGGGNQFEQSLFSTYLNSYQQIVQDTCFGGDVRSFFKTSTDPIQLNVSDSIQLLINEGVSLMTFFGHASSTGFDVNIDAPSSYSNQGKYPLLIGNSCYTGNIHLPGSFSTSENFVLTPNAGVIGFIAKGDLGAPSYLDIWTRNFYEQIFQEQYGSSIGQCMVAAVQGFQSQNMNLFTQNTALTFGLHGDPAIVLNAWEEPDYSVVLEDVLFEPAEISAELETFTVKVAVKNIGKATNDPVGIELIRRYPSGIDSSIVIELPSIYTRDTAFFEFPVDRVNGVGLNSFDVLVDFPANAVSELEDAANNAVYGKELFITSGNLIPIFPFDFAIEPSSQITLKASTGDPFAPAKDYTLQLDTTDGFDSPFMIETGVNATGGVIEWELPIPLQNERVYYWRASSVPEIGEDPSWRMHSFQYLEDQEGWGQSHFEQFRGNRFEQIAFDEVDRDFDFVTESVDLKCTVYGSPGNSFEVNATRYQIDLDVMEYAGCGSTPSLHVAVIDPLTLAPWESNYNNLHPENDFGNLMECANGRARPERYFIFRQNNEEEMEGLSAMLEESIPDGYYVLIYTWRYANYNGWEENAPELFDWFAAQGATDVGAAQDSVPFIFFTRMGDPSWTQEAYGSSIDDLIELELEMEGTFGVGEIGSPVFGPVASWEELVWEFETEANDSTRVKVFGSNISQPDVEINDLIESENGWLELGDEVSAWQYPFIRLSTSLFDEEDQTPAQIDRWQLISEHVPEAALDPSSGFYFPTTTVQQGEPLPLAIAIRNIGSKDMDSLLVRYEIRGNGVVQSIPYPRQDSLRVNETLLDTIYIPTAGLSGEKVLRIEANPRTFGVPDQWEQYHFNNIAELRFTVEEDRINPILDVTFDGTHILNGDLVSAEPFIRVSLDDENPYLLLNEVQDTSVFKLFLTWPDDVQRPVYFSQAQYLQFFPALNDQNKAYLEYRPLLDQDGTYELLVQAQDKSGNLSGDTDYRIEFEVYSKPSITEVLNYPNPFSTRTQFVFNVTGVEPPDEVLIRIMTVGGNVVKEIHTEELGPLKVGRNLTEYWWDGTDEFGDPLANGIYLYLVRARLRGEDLELNPTAASPYFKNGIGKMYLMR